MLPSSHRVVQNSVTEKIPTILQVNLNQDVNGPLAENVMSQFPKKKTTRTLSETKQKEAVAAL